MWLEGGCIVVQVENRSTLTKKIKYIYYMYFIFYEKIMQIEQKVYNKIIRRAISLQKWIARQEDNISRYIYTTEEKKALSVIFNKTALIIIMREFHEDWKLFLKKYKYDQENIIPFIPILKWRK